MEVGNNKNNSESWQLKQDKLAEKNALAVILVDDNGLSTISESNNNSICQQLTNSEKFAPKCEKFCGRVFEKATEANKSLKFKCYAGLECIAVPIEANDNKKMVAITGRTFTSSEDYRKATERAITGDWSEFPSTRFFENVLISSSIKHLENLAREVSELDLKSFDFFTKDLDEEKAETKQIVRESKKDKSLNKKLNSPVNKEKIETVTKTTFEDSKIVTEKLSQQTLEDAIEISEWRSLFNSLLNLEYTNACYAVLEFIKDRFDVTSLAWLENKDNKLQKVLAIGSLKTQEIQISMALDDNRLLNLFRNETSIELKERNSSNDDVEAQRLRLFPIEIGGDVKSALVIGEKAKDLKLEKNIAKFCETVAFELEILRLREELTKRSWLEIALQKFNQSLQMIDSKDFWSRLMQTTAELLQAERGSLLVFEENTNDLIVKSAIGRKSDFIKNIKSKVGDKIAKKVWESGEPLVVPHIRRSNVEPAPNDWKYKTGSFISYPIIIGERTIGVLNLADKVDGSSFTAFDLQLLRSIIPQIAVAIDHASLKNQAGQYKQLSVTDSLTGLLNKRYLEERLDEEIKRSNRHGYPMSFMMIDVDDFKSYNDTFLHPEGDKALKIVGNCLRETLRGADVAARYGGEEFSILLPQTTLDEAETIAERIRQNIEMTKFPNRQITVSVGIASISLSINTVEELIESADKALFAAKHKGKNNVQIFQDQKQEIGLLN